ALADQRELLAQRLGVPADLVERDRTLQLAHEAHVDQVPARLLARGLPVEVLGLLLELGRVRIRRARRLADPGDGRDLRVGGVEQHAVADLHLAHEVARLVVAHAGPGFGADALEVVDREIRGFGLHQPVALARTHGLTRKVSDSVQTASSGISQASGRIASACCTENAAPTRWGGAGRSRRAAKLRSYQPPPMPSRCPAASNATSGATTRSSCSGRSSSASGTSGSGMPWRLVDSGAPGFHGAKRRVSSACSTGRQ